MPSNPAMVPHSSSACCHSSSDSAGLRWCCCVSAAAAPDHGKAWVRRVLTTQHSMHADRQDMCAEFSQHQQVAHLLRRCDSTYASPAAATAATAPSAESGSACRAPLLRCIAWRPVCPCRCCFPGVWVCSPPSQSFSCCCCIADDYRCARARQRPARRGRVPRSVLCDKRQWLLNYDSKQHNGRDVVWIGLFRTSRACGPSHRQHLLTPRAAGSLGQLELHA